MKTNCVFFVTFVGCLWSSQLRTAHAVSITDYPYFASIEVDNVHLCSATIIDDVYVLTSKACVQDVNVTESSVYVRVGTSRLGFRGQVLQATDIVLSKTSYLVPVTTDLAMVKVATPFQYDDSVSWVDTYNNLLEENTEGVVLGWKNNATKKSHMIAASSMVISSESCSTLYEGVYNFSAFQACVMPTLSTSKTCFADVGAPFYLNNQLYGVVSYNPGCDSDLPLVVTAVGESGIFIAQTLCNFQFSYGS